MTYEQLEARLTAWAQTQPAIRAVIVVGSRARGTADRWSDLDAVIFTSDADRYAADPGWLGEFGEVWLTYREDHEDGPCEWYALYAGGLKLDAMLFGIEDSSLELDAVLAEFPYQEVLARGTVVLFDCLGSPRRIAPKPIPLPAPPTRAEFDNMVNGFLLASATTAKFIARGDFWRAQHWFAADLRVHLLTVIRWHAYGQDTWYAGRFLNQWADPRALALIPQTFARYERDSLQAALLASLDLFRLLAKKPPRALAMLIQRTRTSKSPRWWRLSSTRCRGEAHLAPAYVSPGGAD